SVYAPPGHPPREVLRVPGGDALLIDLPVLQHVLEIEQLVLQTHAAVGVHGDDLAQVLAVLAEPAEAAGVEELHLGAEAAGHALLDDLVEHVLLVHPREPRPRRLPVLVEPDAAGAGPDVEEAAVRVVPRRVRVAHEEVGRHHHLRRRRYARERVPEPQDVDVGEEEGVA
uniref:Uncharacterized protein n=1 Tax=Triticum urartu TaxID=4572 RepID=A0A8R7TC39_TRIUA